MQFLAYIVVVLVSFSTILLELHWLTSPARQPAPIVQASAAPPRAKIDGPNVELSPVYPKPEAPRSVGSVTGSTPENSQASADANAKAEAPAPKAETTGVATPAVAPQPADTGAAFKSTVAPLPATLDKTGTAAQPVAAKNSCDVQACARAYTSFSAADCTYQPLQGPRQRCVKPPAQAQQKSAAVAREPKADAAREQSKRAEIERAVQFLRGRKAADEADYNEPMDERGRDVMVRRPGGRW